MADEYHFIWAKIPINVEFDWQLKNSMERVEFPKL